MNCAEASSTVGLLEGRDRKVASPAFAQYAIEWETSCRLEHPLDEATNERSFLPG